MMMPQAMEGHTPHFKIVWDTLMGMGYEESYIRTFDQKAFSQLVLVAGAMSGIITFMNRAIEVAQLNSRQTCLKLSEL
jgi:hypothetical protein